MEDFEQPEEIRNTEDKYAFGANKSVRQWKLGANRVSNKNPKNIGLKLIWMRKRSYPSKKNNEGNKEKKTFKRALY